MTRYTDTQRSRLYKAEREAFGVDLPRLQWVEAERLMRRVFAKFGGDPRTSIRVSDRMRGGHYDQERLEIAIAPTAMLQWILLHEFAHATQWHEARDIADHGPEFARRYLAIIEYIMGFEARERLGAAFRRYKVRTTGASKAAKVRPGLRRRSNPPSEILARQLRGLGAILETSAYGTGWDVDDGQGMVEHCGNLGEVSDLLAQMRGR